MLTMAKFLTTLIFIFFLLLQYYLQQYFQTNLVVNLHQLLVLEANKNLMVILEKKWQVLLNISEIVD